MAVSDKIKTLEGILKDKEKKELTKIVRDVIDQAIEMYDQIPFMEKVASGGIGKRIEEFIERNKTLHSRKIRFYIGYTGRITHYLWETEPKNKDWEEMKSKFQKTCTYYEKFVKGKFTEQYYIDEYIGNEYCLNRGQSGKTEPGIVYLVQFETKN